MKQLFLFDVDGTLTPSRGRINEDFRLWLCNFSDYYECMLVTGSDQPKTVEQLGSYCYEKFDTQFQCSGNQIYDGEDNLLFEEQWALPELAEYFLNNCLYESQFDLRTGNHIEHRPGMVNFSVVGRNADLEQRSKYVSYDKSTNERHTIADAFNTMFPDLQATVGGETGLDISPKGKDKSQIIDHLDNYDTIHFFGDACEEGGNDYPLARRILENNLGIVYNVEDYKETWNILKEIDNAISSIC